MSLQDMIQAEVLQHFLLDLMLLRLNVMICDARIP